MLIETNIPDNNLIIPDVLFEREYLRLKFMRSLGDTGNKTKAATSVYEQNQKKNYTESLSANEIVEKQLILIKHFIQATGMSLFIFDEKKQRLQSKKHIGQLPGRKANKLLTQIVKKVFDENQNCLINDIYEYTLNSNISVTDSGSIIVIPVGCKNKIIGALLFYKKEINGFDLNHIKLYKNYAEEIARSFSFPEQKGNIHD